MSRFSERIRIGISRLQSQAGETVTLRRGPQTTPGVTAIVGSSRFEDRALEGLSVRVRVRDYLIDVNGYQINGAPVEPQSGDELVESIAGVDCVFEVHSPGGSEPPWRFSDPARSRYRIHTREISADD